MTQAGQGLDAHVHWFVGECLQEACPRTVTDLQCQVRFVPCAKVWANIHPKGYLGGTKGVDVKVSNGGSYPVFTCHHD